MGALRETALIASMPISETGMTMDESNVKEATVDTTIPAIEMGASIGKDKRTAASLKKLKMQNRESFYNDGRDT